VLICKLVSCHQLGSSKSACSSEGFTSLVRLSVGRISCLKCDVVSLGQWVVELNELNEFVVVVGIVVVVVVCEGFFTSPLAVVVGVVSSFVRMSCDRLIIEGAASVSPALSELSM